MNFIDRADIFRPPLVRLLAREKRGRPLALQEIIHASAVKSYGDIYYPIGIYEIEAITQTMRWDHVKFNHMMAFIRGCGLGNLEEGESLHRAYNYLRFAARPKTVPFRYLRNHPEWKTYWLPLLINWRRSYGDVGKKEIWPPLKQLLVRLTPLIKQ